VCYNKNTMRFSFHKKHQPAGFTLIELLVVIAIIGLLSSVVFASLNSVRKKARDARRIADLKQIQTALEFYYDANKQYPQPSGGWGVWSGRCSTYRSGDNYDNYILGLAPTYIPTLPRDPSYGDTGGSCYLYNSTGEDYIVLAHGTMETIVGGDPSAAGNPAHIQAMDRPCCSQSTIMVSTPGMRNW
ncbi:MAG: type II secretion system protein, partial [bacterium]|nr:type II secretion system protein [bacterium]